MTGILRYPELTVEESCFVAPHPFGHPKVVEFTAHFTDEDGFDFSHVTMTREQFEDLVSAPVVDRTIWAHRPDYLHHVERQGGALPPIAAE